MIWFKYVKRDHQNGSTVRTIDVLEMNVYLTELRGLSKLFEKSIVFELPKLTVYISNLVLVEMRDVGFGRVLFFKDTKN